MADVPPFVTELEDEDARQEVEAKLADDQALKACLDKVMSKLPPRRRRPPEPTAAEAVDGAAPEAPAELHVPDVIKKMLRGEV